MDKKQLGDFQEGGGVVFDAYSGNKILLYK
jgi:hypothetical protein